MKPEFGSASAWCSNCGCAFRSAAGIEPCPFPSPGVAFVDCGAGNHMFDLDAEPKRGIRSSYKLIHIDYDHANGDPAAQAVVTETRVPSYVVVDVETGVLRAVWE